MTHTALLREGSRILVLLGLFLAGSPAPAQRYLVHTYSEDDGLPSSTIYDVLQDATGRMWFATRAGLAMYDGVDWTSHGLAEGLPRRSQAGLALDDDGTLWALSAVGVQLARWDGERWHGLPSAPPALGGRDGMWAFAVTTHGGRTHAAVGLRAEGLFIWDGEAWFSRADGLPENVHDVIAWDGRFVVATSDGLRVFAGTRLDSTFLSPQSDGDAGQEWSSREVLALALEKRSGSAPRLWLMGRGWAGNVVDGRFTPVSGELPAVALKVRERLVLEPDGLGGVFYGSPAAIYHHNPRFALRSLSPKSGLLAEGATSLFHDLEGNLWIGSFRGLNKIASFRFETWDQSHGLLENEVTAVLQRRNGGYVVGHPNGLTFFDPAQSGNGRIWRIREPSDREETGLFRVLDLAEDAAGRIWIATNSLGVARIDRVPSEWVPSEGVPSEDSVALRASWYRSADMLPATSVRVDARGAVWALGGTGVHRFDGHRFVLMRSEPNLSPRRLFAGSGQLGSGDELYLATGTDGVHVLTGGHWRRLGYAEPGADDVFAVLEDSSGRLWAGTSAGLFRVRGGGLERARLGATEVRRPVYFLLEDTAGRLWMGTDNGVLRWNESAAELRHFTVSEGLGGRETNRAAGLVDSLGRVWIGTDRGLTRYREAFEREIPPPRIELREVEAAGRAYPLTGSLTLGPAHRDLVFRFRALSFVDEHRLTFRSRLEGFDDEWLEEYASPRQEIRYTNLSPGTYRLLLQARNAAGVWSEVAASPLVHITRPYWQRGWFRTLAVLGAIAVLYLVQRFLAQRRYARRLEADVRRRTAELEAERTRLAVTLDSITDGVIVAAADGSVRRLNPAAEKITGWSSAEATGRPLSQVLRLSSGAAAPEADGIDPVDRVRQAGRAVHLSEAPAAGAASQLSGALTMHDRQGRVSRLDVTGAPLGEAAGTMSGVVVAFRDVTARLELEKEALKVHKLESVGVLAGGIAHEFNNALAGVLGNLELLELERPGQDAAGFLDEARNEVFRARNLTQRLLTFSKGGAPIRRSVSLADVVQGAVSSVAERNGVSFQTALPDDLWPADIDGGQIHQALAHLLRNAQQAMPEGGTVHIAARNLTVEESGADSLKPGPYVSLEIADRGPGIPPQHLSRVFDPYFTTWPGHSGLGLTTAYSVVTNHDGRLTVSSPAAGGTLVRVDLPASARTHPDQVSSAGLATGGRLLLMDDDETVLLVTGKMLSRLGYDYESARHGEQALELFREARRRGEPFGAVILDLKIPGGMGGRETLEHLRRLDPDVRAVVCSGYSNDPVMAKHRDYGFRAVLPKPFRMDALAQTLQQVLARP